MRLDVLELSIERLEQIVRDVWACGLGGIVHLHWSPMCTTLSRASRGRGQHRWPDLSPRSDTAKAHDLRFHMMIGVIEALAQRAPLICISVENPLSDVFPSFPDLQALAAKPGWQFVLRPTIA